MEFRHDGICYGFNIYALDLADAERRLRSIRGNSYILGELGGVIACSIATSPFVGLYVRILCWWRNLWGAPRDE